jgi:flagellar biosynthesis/type III secretory pathway protein FliH
MGALNTDAMSAFVVPEIVVSPFEFRSLGGEEMEAIFAAQRKGPASDTGNGQRTGRIAAWDAGGGVNFSSGYDQMTKDAMELARKEGFEQGDKEGRYAARAEVEVEMRAAVAQEQSRMVAAVTEFGAVRERYFQDVEQEVVKLSLAIAGRVLHREAQVDPLLLSGVVRVALDKMQDRSGVVLRVAGADVKIWEEAFTEIEESERPKVVEDIKMQRGDCRLETKMGTVELGIGVQMEEIEKGFFDLLNHRPVK